MSLDNSDYLNTCAGAHRHVKDDVVANREGAEPGTKVISLPPHHRMPSELLELSVNCPKTTLCGLWVVGGNEIPDGFQIPKRNRSGEDGF